MKPILLRSSNRSHKKENAKQPIAVSATVPKTETLRSGHVVQTVQCKGCAGNVRLKVVTRQEAE